MNKSELDCTVTQISRIARNLQQNWVSTGCFRWIAHLIKSSAAHDACRGFDPGGKKRSNGWSGLGTESEHLHLYTHYRFGFAGPFTTETRAARNEFPHSALFSISGNVEPRCFVRIADFGNFQMNEAALKCRLHFD
jgi:hypothetical protein